jgi:nitroreductase
MEFEQALRFRRSTRRFAPEQLTEAELRKILLAGQAAPLASGDAPTTLITVVQRPEVLDEIKLACALRSKRSDQPLDAFYGAPTAIFLSAADISDDHIEYCNVACVIENMILQAAALGLGSVYIWGCLRKLRAKGEALAKLELPPGYELLSALALGRPETPLAPAEPQEKMAVKII